jgi:hypothetical protein
MNNVLILKSNEDGFLKYFSYYSQKMMISPYYFGPPVLIDPVYTLKTG